jgi:hypothetical protein
MGWWFDGEAETWLLLGEDGRPVPGSSVPAEALKRDGCLGRVNAAFARRLWPELVPGFLAWHCVLDGGPRDGKHEYLDPGDYAEPPAVLLVAWDGRAEPSGPVELTHAAQYQRGAEWCGHDTCPVPYRWQPPAG